MLPAVTADLSPELRLIVASVRRALGNGSNEAVRDAARAQIDWTKFVELVGKHGVAPLVHVALQATSGAAPERVAGWLRVTNAATVLHHKTSVEPTLALALDLLHQAGLRPIVLKGGALAYTAYPNPQYRTLADIDLLLEPGDLDCGHAALIGGGFEVADVGTPIGHHHLPPYLSPDRKFAVELHAHLVNNGSPYALSLAPLAGRARVDQLGPRSAHVLSPADMLFHVCIHLAYGHRYQWYPVRTLADILAITTTSTDVDWDLLIAQTVRSRATGTLYWPLWLAREWLGAPIPEYVLTRLQPGALIQHLVAPVIQSQYVFDQAPTGAGRNVLYNAIRELSLYSGCSTPAQLGATLRTLFPNPDGVGHLPPDLKGSRLRYGVYLSRPQRIARGLWAMGSLLRARRQSAADSNRPRSKIEVKSLPGVSGIGVQ